MFWTIYCVYFFSQGDHYVNVAIITAQSSLSSVDGSFTTQFLYNQANRAAVPFLLIVARGWSLWAALQSQF